MTDSHETIKKELKKLDVQKQALESEAEAIASELTSPGPEGETPMGIDTPLIDSDGYPRGDIDLVRARTLRKRLIEIKNDHKSLMKKIEHGLIQLTAASNPDTNSQNQAEMDARLAAKPKPAFDSTTGRWTVENWDGTKVAGPTAATVGAGGPGTANGSTATATAPTTVMEAPPTEGPTSMSAPTVPFAIVDGVAPDSPASSAGLHEGDLIVSFGPIHYGNHNNLRAIAELVPEVAGDNGEIDIAVLRRRRNTTETDDVQGVDATVHVTRRIVLKPQPWGGRGLIGCHIVQYNEEMRAQYHEPAMGDS